MSLKNLFFVTLTLFSILQTLSQRNYDSYNRLGIDVGMVFFDINTSDFNTEQGEGFMGGFTTRGSFRNNFDLIYGLNFYNSKIGIQGSSGNDTQFIGYTIQAVQINFCASYNIIKHHISLEAGPVLNINSKMKLDSDRYENYIIENYTTLTADDIQDISKVNFHLMAGLTAGIEKFRVIGQYQYGVTNTLNNLNDKDLEYSDFKGNSSTIVVAVVFYF